jgi:hypothetical protein
MSSTINQDAGVIKAGDIIKYRNGHIFEVRFDGTFINFDTCVWVSDAIKSYEKGELIAIYPKEHAIQLK